MWGYGGVVQAPDGAIWKVATSAKKDTGPATRKVDKIVLLMGATDVAASKRFYVRSPTRTGSRGRPHQCEPGGGLTSTECSHRCRPAAPRTRHFSCADCCLCVLAVTARSYVRAGCFELADCANDAAGRRQ